MPLNGFEYVFQFLVLAHPLIWINILRYKVKIGVYENLLVLLFPFTFMYVKITGFSVGYYNTGLIMLYIFMSLTAYTLYSYDVGKLEAFCMALLTVQLNSYYWELPLHIYEFFNVGLYAGQLVQLTRLLPLLYFKDYKLSKNGWRVLLLGPVLTVLVVLIRINTVGVFSLWVRELLYMVTRFTCMLFLVYAIRSRIG